MRNKLCNLNVSAPEKPTGVKKYNMSLNIRTHRIVLFNPNVNYSLVPSGTAQCGVGHEQETGQ